MLVVCSIHDILTSQMLLFFFVHPVRSKFLLLLKVDNDPEILSVQAFSVLELLLAGHIIETQTELCIWNITFQFLKYYAVSKFQEHFLCVTYQDYDVHHISSHFLLCWVCFLLLLLLILLFFQNFLYLFDECNWSNGIS